MTDEFPIPAEWCRTVARILREGDRRKITTTRRSTLEWEALFPDEPWDFIRFEAMAKALEHSGVCGLHITTMAEPGETYAFWFTHRSIPIYGKINLLPNGHMLIVYSSHSPNKGIGKL
jgi:hypothetical protein